MMPLWSFQGARARAHSEKTDQWPVSQNSTACAEPRYRHQIICCLDGASNRGRHDSRRAQASDGRIHHELGASGVKSSGFPRKEVIQPQLPLRLPCYDFTPIIDPTFGGSLLTVRTPTSGIADFRGVTGGVYKARERIHRDVADSRLLATPPSWRRVSASNPNRDRLFGIRLPSRVCSPLYRPM
jgi:hypothetical protein